MVLLRTDQEHRGIDIPQCNHTRTAQAIARQLKIDDVVAEVLPAGKVAAVRRLKAKADLYAQATGMRIAGLKSLNEGGGYSPPQPMFRAMAANVVSDSTPVEPGELTVRIDIQGVYELAN